MTELPTNPYSKNRNKSHRTVFWWNTYQTHMHTYRHKCVDTFLNEWHDAKILFSKNNCKNKYSVIQFPYTLTIYINPGLDVRVIIESSGS